jgi:hypothetical protein
MHPRKDTIHTKPLEEAHSGVCPLYGHKAILCKTCLLCILQAEKWWRRGLWSLGRETPVNFHLTLNRVLQLQIDSNSSIRPWWKLLSLLMSRTRAVVTVYGIKLFKASRPRSDGGYDLPEARNRLGTRSRPQCTPSHPFSLAASLQPISRRAAHPSPIRPSLTKVQHWLRWPSNHALQKSLSLQCR